MVKAAARADARAASAEAPGKTLLVACTGTRIEPVERARITTVCARVPTSGTLHGAPGSRTMRRRSRA